LKSCTTLPTRRRSPTSFAFAGAALVWHTQRFMPGRLTCACLALAAIPSTFPQSKPVATAPATPFPTRETLSYSIEWRLIYAGDARLTLEPKASTGPQQHWESKLHIESGGLVSKLYKLEDNYEIQMEDQFCTDSTVLNALERTKHRETKVVYDRAKGKASYVERDLLKNSVTKTAETDITGCFSDIIGGMYKLRTLKLEPGQSAQLSLSDGNKSVSARIEAQQREQLKIKAGTFNTIRYEAFVFNGVLYSRKAELQIWLTDDARRMPVQIRARMGFPIGSITLELDKEEHL
jgi:hypothetical protein